jgi:hypothetical protein
MGLVLSQWKLWADFLQLSSITDTLFSFQSVEHPPEQIKSLSRSQYVPPKCQNDLPEGIETQEWTIR